MRPWSLFLLVLAVCGFAVCGFADASAAPHRKASSHAPHSPHAPHAAVRVRSQRVRSAPARVRSAPARVHSAPLRSERPERSVILARRHRSRHILHTSSRGVNELIPPVQRVKFVPAMKGSRESLVRQNVIAAAEGLDRIEDDDQLSRMVDSEELVLLPAGSGLHINDAMPVNRRYCRPWTGKFLSDLARVHAQRFRSALIVTSAVRTAEYQRHLLLINGNAAAAEGDLASPHLTGATVDIAKKGMSRSEIGWLRAYLLPLQTVGKIDVEEEFRQACFHITVYNSYLPAAEPPTMPGHGHDSRDAMLATRLH